MTKQLKKQLICAALLLALHYCFARAQGTPPMPEIAVNSCDELQNINSRTDFHRTIGKISSQRSDLTHKHYRL